MSRETKRTAAHFLNGLAIAALAAGLIGPVASGKADIIVATGSILAGCLFHVLVIVVVRFGR